VVFDDTVFNDMSLFKCWFGAQYEFNVTDKYCRKKRHLHGRVCIGAFNSDPRGWPWADVDWMERNCVFVHVSSPMSSMINQGGDDEDEFGL